MDKTEKETSPINQDELLRVFSRRLRSARKKKGITERKASEVSDVAQTSISDYETGKSLPDPEPLKFLADYYGVSTDYLLGLTEFIAPVEKCEEKLYGNTDLIQIYNTLTRFSDQYRRHFLTYMNGCIRGMSLDDEKNESEGQTP